MKNMRAILCAVLLAVLAITMELHSLTRRNTNLNVTAQSSALAVVVAGPGLVEPGSEEIKLGSELGGKLKSINVEEGDVIRKGQVLAVLENDDYRAELASAAAEMRAREATLRKVVNGAQEQERSGALASARAAEAVLQNAQENLERRQELFDAGVISREELERSTKEYNVAKQELQENRTRYSLLNSKAREEDVSLAQADLDMAKAQVADAQAKCEKTILRSPIDGSVLRKHHRSGESVSDSATSPDPVVTIGDSRELRVRVDVDEADVNRVHLGQKVYVTADAFGQQKFWGRVTQIGELLGPKSIHTDEPGERADRKFLEVLVDLDRGAKMPIGLRVDAFLLEGGEQTAK